MKMSLKKTSLTRTSTGFREIRLISHFSVTPLLLLDKPRAENGDDCQNINDLSTFIKFFCVNMVRFTMTIIDLKIYFNTSFIMML